MNAEELKEWRSRTRIVITHDENKSPVTSLGRVETEAVHDAEEAEVILTEIEE